METGHPFRLSHDANFPLKCDKDGNLRILVVGNSGTGKSTMAERLSSILQLPMIHLDQMLWQPGWREAPKDEFRSVVQRFLRENDNWIVDGNYRKLTSDLTWATATCILWMDPPFALYFPRLIMRTFLRLIRVVPPCSPGCNERWGEVFSWGEQNILWWSWTLHTTLRKDFIGAMQLPGDDQGGKWVRFTEWGRDVDAWLKRVGSFAKAQ